MKIDDFMRSWNSRKSGIVASTTIHGKELVLQSNGLAFYDGKRYIIDDVTIEPVDTCTEEREELGHANSIVLTTQAWKIR